MSRILSALRRSADSGFLMDACALAAATMFILAIGFVLGELELLVLAWRDQ